VAFGALLRRRLVKKNVSAGNHTKSLVAEIAFDVSVTALERELGSLIVIKRGGHPSRDIMAVCAGCLSGLRDELTAVFIRVAFFALLRCAFKLRLL